MRYPTATQVEAASHQELARWMRFLRSPGMRAIEADMQWAAAEAEREVEAAILALITARFHEAGGWNAELSKAVGWDEPKT